MAVPAVQKLGYGPKPLQSAQNIPMFLRMNNTSAPSAKPIGSRVESIFHVLLIITLASAGYTIRSMTILPSMHLAAPSTSGFLDGLTTDEDCSFNPSKAKSAILCWHVHDFPIVSAELMIWIWMIVNRCVSELHSRMRVTLSEFPTRAICLLSQKIRQPRLSAPHTPVSDT